MSWDTHSLFGFGTIDSVISQSGTTLVITLLSGQGARFAVGQQVTLGPARTLLTIDNAMVGRVTGVSIDTITIDYGVSNREGSSVQTILASYVIGQGVTPKVLTDLETAVDANSALTTAAIAKALKSLTTNIDVSAATAPTVGQVLTAVDSTHATWQANTASTDGWTASSDTLVYVSASSFKIAAVDRTKTYTKGTRVKFTNNSVTFYGVVIDSSFSTDTTVTLAPNSDYAIANSAITVPFYSYDVNPQGYPGRFNYATTWAGFSVNPTDTFRFSVVGNICTITMVSASSGTSNATTASFTVPVASARQVFMAAQIGVRDNSAIQSTPGHIEFSGATTTALLWKSFYEGSWTASGQKQIFLNNFAYEF